MKNYLFIFLFFLTFTGFSQENVIKIKLPGLTYGNYNFSYERAINEKNSLNLSVGLLSPNGAIKNLKPEWYKELGIAEDAPWIGEFYTGFHTSIDYRFYGKEALKGFYFAPYVKYWTLDFRLEDEIEGPYYNIEATMNGIGAGVQIGYQWILFKMLSLDLYAGLGAQRFSATGTYVINPVQSGFDYATIVDDVIEGYDKVPYVERNLETTVEPNDLRLKIPLMLPDFRGGFSIGFAF